jgi:hypothetical protein
MTNFEIIKKYFYATELYLLSNISTFDFHLSKTSSQSSHVGHVVLIINTTGNKIIQSNVTADAKTSIPSFMEIRQLVHKLLGA